MTRWSSASNHSCALVSDERCSCVGILPAIMTPAQSPDSYQRQSDHGGTTELIVRRRLNTTRGEALDARMDCRSVDAVTKIGAEGPAPRESMSYMNVLATLLR